MLTFERVSVVGCGVRIVDGLDLALPERGTAVILGPSGCGKTTLLRCAIREDEDDPDLSFSGVVRLRGRDVRERGLSVHHLRQQVGLVLQTPVAFPGTAFDNVTFALQCTTSLAKAEIDERAARALAEVGLEPEHHATRAVSLSGGQLRRLSIARTVALDPAVLLMDEPSAGLDPLAVARLEHLVRTLSRRRLVVIVTHDVELARRIADEVHFLWPFPDGCRLVESGSAAQLLDAPQRSETRLFIDAATRGAAALAELGGRIEDSDAEECLPRRIRLKGPVTAPSSRPAGSAKLP